MGEVCGVVAERGSVRFLARRVESEQDQRVEELVKQVRGRFEAFVREEGWLVVVRMVGGGAWVIRKGRITLSDV